MSHASRIQRWVVFLLAVVAAVALVASLPAAAAQASERRCGSFKVGSYRAYVTVQRGPTSCKAARRVLRDLYNGAGTSHGTPPNDYRRIRGWRCDTGTGGGACGKRGTKYDNYKDFVSAEVR